MCICQQKPAPPAVEEVADKEGHFIVRPNTYINHCEFQKHVVIAHSQQLRCQFPSAVKIEKLLGQGTFGKVVAARDEKSQRMYAIKVM